MNRPSHRQTVYPRVERGRLDWQAVPPRQKQSGQLYTLYQAPKILDDRNDQGEDYTILSDSTAAIAQARSDNTGTGQPFAIATIEVCSRLASRGTP